MEDNELDAVGFWDLSEEYLYRYWVYSFFSYTIASLLEGLAIVNPAASFSGTALSTYPWPIAIYDRMSSAFKKALEIRQPKR